MDDEEIVRVVEALVGNIEPIADSHYDSKALININILGNVINSLICKLGNISLLNYNSPYASEKECAIKSAYMLKEAKRNIDDYLAIEEVR